MANTTQGTKTGGYRKALRGDVRSLVRIDNPDDAEFATPLGEGDGESLVKIDSPDDADIYPADDGSGGKAGASDDGKGVNPKS